MAKPKNNKGCNCKARGSTPDPDPKKKRGISDPDPCSGKPSKVPRIVKRVKLCVTPDLPPKENSGFRVIELENGLKALLISTDEKQNKDPAWSLTFPDMNCAGSNYEPPSYIAPVLGRVGCHGPHPSDDRHCCIGLPGGSPPKPKCTASVMLRSGAHQDPQEFQGMAHFCEHVVHHGSELYPGEDDVRKFIHEHEGYSNAYTDKNVTNYHFQVNSSPEVLRKVLHMYGDLLRAPLFPVEALKREVESIDNEYHLRRINLFFQRDQLLNTVAIVGEHPMKQFMIGSKDSLLHSGEQRLQQAAKKFHEDYYYAQNMRLVVRSPESLDFMQECVTEAFSEIPRESPSRNDKSCAGGPPEGVIPFNMTAFNRLYTVKPRCNDGHMLFVTWALSTDAWKVHHRCKPLDYIGAVLCDEAPGGLPHFLRSKGWSLLFHGGCSPHGTYRNNYVSMFEVAVSLTQDGRAHVSDVIEAIFSFIKLHQNAGAQEHIWENLQKIEQAKFESMKLGKSVQDAQRLSGTMHLFEDKDLVTGSSLFLEYDADSINDYLDELEPQKANFMLFTLDTGRNEYQVEHFYDTEYIAQDLPKSLMNKLQRVQPYKEFLMRTPADANPDAIVPTVKIEDICAVTEIIAMNEKFAVQYTPHREMASPQGNICVVVQSGMDPRNIIAKKCVMNLWACMMQLMALPTMTHQAEMGVRVGMGFLQQNAGLIFQVAGLNHRLAPTIMQLLEYLDKFEEQVTPSIFDMGKALVLRSVYSAAVRTESLAFDLLNCLRYVGLKSHYEAHELLMATNYEDFLDFVREFKESMRLECKVEGVILRSDAIHVAFAMQAIRTQPLGMRSPGTFLASITKKNVGFGEKCLRVKSIQPKERITTVVNYYELAPSTMETMAIVKLLNSMIQAKLFHELRTIEQLGYSVNGGIAMDSLTTGFIIYISTHADKHSPCYVDGRIERFLLKFYEEDLVKNVAALTPLLQKHCIYRDPVFVQMFFTKYFLNGGIDSGYKKLSVQVVGCKGGPCVCKNYKNGEAACRESAWMPQPKGSIGKEKTPVHFACERSTTSGSGSQGDGSEGPSSGAYFIRSIPDYHNSE